MAGRELYLRIRNVRSRKMRKSAIFSGYEVDHNGSIVNSHVIVVANAFDSVLKRNVYIGQVWHLKGQPYQYKYTINGYNKVEDQIQVTEASLHSGAGDNFIAYITGSDAFPGIGDVKARKLWEFYGKDIYSLLSNKDDEIVKDIANIVGEKSALTFFDGWKTDGLFATLDWLDDINIPFRIGEKVANYYQHKTQAKIEEDPYRLTAFCTSWRKTDDLALHKFKIQPDDPRRLQGGIEESLYSAYAQKHTALDRQSLMNRLSERLIPKDTQGIPTGNVTSLQARNWARLAMEMPSLGVYYKSEHLYHPAGAYLMEQFIAEKIFSIQQVNVGKEIKISDVHKAISAYEKSHKDKLPNGLAKAQKNAVISSVYSPFLLISGGAGTGKTTVLKCIYYVLNTINVVPIQMALAGRAAKRMQDATDMEAFTIAAFIKNYEDEPEKLTKDSCIVVDEASMVDLLLAYRIFDIIPIGCRLIMVGDEVQLPPIGPGLIFHALIEFNKIERVHLTEVKRQSDSTGIPAIAKAVREHQWPHIDNYKDIGLGVSFYHCIERDISDAVISLYDALGGSDGDVRVIAPTKAHNSGVYNINLMCQEKYRINDISVSYYDNEHQSPASLPFKVNDHVMWLTNDYERGLRNGTLGIIKEFLGGDAGAGEALCRIDFEGNEIDLNLDDMDRDHLSLSYSITCHKAQGSQFRRIIVPVYPWSKLDQSWVYTALTRGVEQVVFVGNEALVKDRVRKPSTAANRTIGLPLLLERAFAQKRSNSDTH